jgi:hypothetical protein
MRRVSISEIIKYESCRREWKYSYSDRLMLKERGRGGPMASGSAVHYVVEHVCTVGMGVPHPRDVKALALESLRADFDDDERQVTKFLPGVMRAVSKIPDDIWEKEWHVEWDLSMVFDGPGLVERGPNIAMFELIGRPDLWSISGAPDGIIELLDVKTTKTDPLTYMLWEPQITWYAMMLQKLYPQALIKYRYLCVPTQGDKPAPQAPTWVFKAAQLTRAYEEVVRLVSEMDPAHTEMRRGRKCDWCEFNKLCTAEVTGADVSGLREELYTVKPTQEERTKELYADG